MSRLYRFDDTGKIQDALTFDDTYAIMQPDDCHIGYSVPTDIGTP